MKQQLLILLLLPLFSFSQENYCSFNTNKLSENYYQYLQGHYPNDNEIDEIINEIASKIGLEKNFVYVNSPGIDNCVALNYDGFRYILYDTNFLRYLSYDGTKKPSIYISVLSHEIGHHLQGHTLKNISEVDNKLGELEADKFSGYIMAKFGFKLSEAQEAIQSLNDSYSSTHPTKSQRLNAIKLGFNMANYQIEIQRDQIENNLFVKYYMEGQESLRENKFIEASENFTTAITLNKKNNFFPLCLRAIAYSKAKNFQLALNDYSKMESIEMSDEKVLGNYLFYNRGVTYEEMEKFNAAADDFYKATELNPDDKISMMKFAINQSLAGNHLSASGAFEFQISDDEIYKADLEDFTKGDIFLQKGISYFHTAEMEYALKYFNIAAELYPKEYTKLALPDFYKGKVYQQLGNKNQAISSYLKFLETNNKEQNYFIFDINYERANEVFFNLATIYQEQKKYDLSSKYINQLIDREPKNSNAYALRGFNYYFLENNKMAKSDFKTSCELGSSLGCKTFKELDDSNSLGATNSVNSILPISGGYRTDIIKEYIFNSSDNKYILTKELNTRSRLYFDNKYYAFKRGKNDWLSAEWTYSGYDKSAEKHIFYDNYGQNIIFDKDLKTITWYIGRNDDHFEEIIVYQILQKDDTIKPQEN